MHWQDAAIILTVRPHGERHAIAELFAKAHGRWRGLVHGGGGRRLRPLLQPGNVVQAEWRARSEDQLGHLRLEPQHHAAALALGSRPGLAIIESLVAELRLCPEHAAHEPLFDGAQTLLQHLAEPLAAAALLARFELALLAELGYGLDLSRCALTGSRENLAWVSPRSGRAATLEAGRPWAGRLLRLPPFLLGEDAAPTPADIADALRLTAHFLRHRLFEPRNMPFPPQRQALVQLVQELPTGS